MTDYGLYGPLVDAIKWLRGVLLVSEALEAQLAKLPPRVRQALPLLAALPVGVALAQGILAALPKKA